MHDWQAGRSVCSASAPRIELYPNFLSEEECEHLCAIALKSAPAVEPFAACVQALSLDSAQSDSCDTDGEDAPDLSGSEDSDSDDMPEPYDNSGRTHSIWPDNSDPVVRRLEERCAAVTGVPEHPDEEPLGLRWTAESSAQACARGMVSSLHVDTNQGGTYRCATVLMYLHDLADGLGGETRFPLVGAPEGSPTREAAEKALRCQVTALSSDMRVEWPPVHCRRTLFDAAEDPETGLWVRPRRRLAAVFWTQTSEGVDPCSWHAGARLRPGGGYKLLAQKFKALPAAYRTPPLRLPSVLAPPPGPDCAARRCSVAHAASI